MLFKCVECGGYGFTRECSQCTGEGEPRERSRRRTRIPVDPALLPDFAFQADGFLEAVLPPVRRNAEQEWQERVDGILDAYRELREPYFVNFLHLGRSRSGAIVRGAGPPDMELLQRLLVRLGFDDLTSFDGLVPRLVRSTQLQQEVRRFARRAENVVSSDGLRSTLRNWIEERGATFQRRLPLMLYFLWQEGQHPDEIDFSPGAPPLVDGRELRRIYRLCDDVHLEILLDRLQVSLEQFDPSEFVTMYDLDAMSGRDFERFVGDLFRARGFEVRETKQTADQGADVFAERFGQQIVIQVKNYQGSVGNSAVQQAISAREFYSCDRAMVLTNSRFTASARSLAESSDVRLVDRDELRGFLDDYNRWRMESGSHEAAEGPMSDAASAGGSAGSR